MLEMALTPSRLQAAMIVSGNVKGEVFAACLTQVLVSGDVIVLDNPPTHKVAFLAEVVDACGACLLSLPPYSPDFNLIELTFRRLKIWLRTTQPWRQESLESILLDATNWINGYDAENWFAHCSYHVRELESYCRSALPLDEEMKLGLLPRTSFGIVMYLLLL